MRLPGALVYHVSHPAARMTRRRPQPCPCRQMPIVASVGTGGTRAHTHGGVGRGAQGHGSFRLPAPRGDFGRRLPSTESLHRAQRGVWGTPPCRSARHPSASSAPPGVARSETVGGSTHPRTAITPSKPPPEVRDAPYMAYCRGIRRHRDAPGATMASYLGGVIH